jgi:tetratricopeptide (TPR) repeat protein
MTASSQHYPEDSLIHLINNADNDSLKTLILIRLGAQISDLQPDSAYFYFQEADRLLEGKEDVKTKLKIINHQATILQYIGKYPEALQLLFDGQKMLESQTEILTDSTIFSDYITLISNIGIIYYSTGKYEEALVNFQKGLNILDTTHLAVDSDIVKMAFFRLNLNAGAVHTKTRNFEKADFYFTKALQYLPENDDRSYGILLNNLSIVAREKDQMDRAFELNRKAIEVSIRANNQRTETQSYNNYGSCFLEVGKYDSALKYYNTSLTMARKYNFTISEQIALELLSAAYDSVGNYKKAYETHLALKQISDSLLDMEKLKLVTQLEMQEKFDKRMNESRLQQQKLEAEQRKRELIYTLIIVFIAMALIIASLLFYLQRSKSRRHQLEAEKNQLLSKSLGMDKSKLEEELEFKNKELATNVMYMIRKNELITQISEKLIKSKLAFKKENQRIIDEIIRDLQSSTDDDIWKDFEIRFQQVHNDFYEKLNENFPNLSSNEKRLCAFLRLNMSTKEISAITYQSLNSITVARSRLRKKLGLDTEENLIAFLEGI